MSLFLEEILKEAASPTGTDEYCHLVSLPERVLPRASVLASVR